MRVDRGEIEAMDTLVHDDIDHGVIGMFLIGRGVGGAVDDDVAGGASPS